MKLLIIRHADPDYSVDSLTETGKIEAELLSRRLEKLNIKEFYCSPLGRAIDTSLPTLKKLGRKAKILPWLQELPVHVYKTNYSKPDIPWDWLPSDWSSRPEFYDREKWWTAHEFSSVNLKNAVDEVWAGLDQLTANHGYVREGNIYRVAEPNDDTVVLFCHFGLECVLLSHLLGISPMPLWHGLCAAPSSVTTLVTEERRKGIACFRMSSFGDISHLYIDGREPSFSARFCETYDKSDQRHD